MGNRAIVALSQEDDAPAIYLHWDGSPESVLAFLAAAEALGVRSPELDEDYFLSRFGQIAANYIGGTASIGYGRAGHMDSSDNGLYVIESFSSVKNRDRTLTQADMCKQVFAEAVMRNYGVFKKMDRGWEEQAEALIESFLAKVSVPPHPVAEDE